MSTILAISRILCAVDLSDLSRRALRHAIVLAQQHQARLRVLLVVDPGFPPSSGMGTPFEVSAEARAAFEEDLQWFVAPLLAGELSMDLHVRDGHVAREIVADADETGAGVIVIGTHGRGGFERLALGSVAEKVIRTASCPVLAVPAGDESWVPALARRVLCPTDFSEASARAVTFARFMALTSGAALWFVNVVEWPFGETTGTDAVSMLCQSMEDEAKARLAETARPVGGPPTETFVRKGTPWREIVDLARANRVGLIVMGVSGRGAIDVAWLGSTTRHVIREAPCPVLTVKRLSGC